MKFNNYIRLYFVTTTLLALPLIGREVEVRIPNGDNFVMNVSPDVTVLNFLGQIEEMMDPIDSTSNLMVEGEKVSFVPKELFEHQKFILEFSFASVAADHPSAQKSATVIRDYSIPVTKDEKKNISYIVTTLANKSLVKILSLKSSLEKAGDKLQLVHPLRFLMCIFTDEELKVCVHNIMGRSWVWKDFMKSLNDSLEEENKKGNVTDFVMDFSHKVGIDFGLIYPLAQERRWEDFVKMLSAYIPRQGNPDRYDM